MTDVLVVLLILAIWVAMFVYCAEDLAEWITEQESA